MIGGAITPRLNHVTRALSVALIRRQLSNFSNTRN